MEHFYTNFLKPALFFISTVIVSLITPIQDVLCVLALGFALNIFIGIVTDTHVNQKDFNIKKAFDAIAQLAMYSALVYYVHNSLATLGFNVWSDKATVWITFIVSYYYLANILRNATKIFPQNKAFELMYMILTTKIFSAMRHYFRLSIEDENNHLTKKSKNGKSKPTTPEN